MLINTISPLFLEVFRLLRFDVQVVNDGVYFCTSTRKFLMYNW